MAEEAQLSGGEPAVRLRGNGAAGTHGDGGDDDAGGGAPELTVFKGHAFRVRGPEGMADGPARSGGSDGFRLGLPNSETDQCAGKHCPLGQYVGREA
ncbi:hypothetical protein [Streptomyces sp. SID9727]|uniref:hypothetical protein n=1 Tax=Streptomyces sp. SID9727 TaxID=2706114 RepID=UPI0013C72439|nr:hypothetical protein [Streptomyces sp. SID9727]NEC69488.1 hypothetical protein [Streptomyces sp. SID9727]